MGQQRCTATVSEIASALSKTPQAIHGRIKRQKWQEVEDARVQGGGEQYDIATLPLKQKEAKTLRAFLARKSVNATLAAAPLTHDGIESQAAEREQERRAARQQSLATFDRLPAWQKRGAAAKLEIIKACAEFITHTGLAKTTGEELFTHEYNLGRIDVAPWVRVQVPDFHVSTLRGWITAERELGTMGLVDCYGNRKGQSKIETYITGVDAKRNPVKPLAKAILACMIEHPHIRAKHVNEYLRGKLPEAPVVSDKSVGRWMDAWKAANPVEWAHITNPDRAKGSYQPAFGRVAEGVEGPNKRWEIDATPADLLLTDGRHKIMGNIDVGTRRLMFRVSKTERAADNLLLVRRCLLTWGVPRGGVFVIDNGKPYVSEHFQRALSDLEITPHICKPFASEEKPFIERAWHTLSHDLIELLPGYCGHNVAERKDIEARRSFAKRLLTKGEQIEISMSAAELQAFLDRWCATYHDRVHSELKMSPNQALAAFPHPIHTINDERALDVLLSPSTRNGGWCTPTKRKGITIDKIEYYHPHLSDWFGKQVRPLLTDDLGKIVVYAPNSEGVLEFLFIAENPELCGIKRAELAAIAKNHHKKIIKEAEALKRQARKELAGKSVGELIQEYREEKAAEARGNLTYFPRPTIDYTTPGLQAAGMAAAALSGKSRAPLEHSPELQAKRAALVPMAEEAAAPARAPRKIIELQVKPAGFSVPEGRKERWELWCDIDQRIKDDGEVSEEEAQFWASFRNSPTWKSFAMVYRTQQ